MIGLLTWHCHLGRVSKLWQIVLGMIDTNKHLKQPCHALCDCEALAFLRCRHLGDHCLKPGDFANICIGKVMPFVQSVGPLNA
jgi:hypothetical protein